jgi:hypothetical protein
LRGSSDAEPGLPPGRSGQTDAAPCQPRERKHDERLDEFDLTVAGQTVYVVGPDGFRHELELPEDAEMSRLAVELFKGFLELRAPRRAT